MDDQLPAFAVENSDWLWESAKNVDIIFDITIDLPDVPVVYHGGGDASASFAPSMG